MAEQLISVILPVYHEEGSIAVCLRGLSKALEALPHEILVCYDFDEDTTLPAIATMEERPVTVRLVRNTLGRGAAAAIRTGFQAARGDVLVVSMADLSDPPDVIGPMARKIREEGADVVIGSRYMKGGSQTGGPRLKRLLSRAAGWSLRWLTGMGTHDPTTSFRAYSRRFIERVEVQSRFGRELALELTVKAYLEGFRVDEVPSARRDRSAGQSRLWTWLPRTLSWYLKAMAAPLMAWGALGAASIAALLFAIGHAPVAPFWPDEWTHTPVVTGHRPFSLDWLLAFHNEHRIPLPKLLWFGVARMSGFDCRWGVTLNVALLTLAGAIVLLAVRRFRGRLVWTDAFLSLLFLHWGHWENLTWPFQVCFALHTLLVAVLFSGILSFRRSPAHSSTLAFSLALPALPLCGASTLPFVVLIAPWWIWRLWNEKPRRALAFLWPVASLLIIPAYFIGARTPPQYPPNPGLTATLSVALECLTGSLGPAAVTWWPVAGVVASGILLLAVGLLVRGARRDPALRIPARGLFLILCALGALALVIGQSRAGVSGLVGFTSRYGLLFSSFPLIAYVAADFSASPLLQRLICSSLFATLAVFAVLNGSDAISTLNMRDVAGHQLLRDVRAGMPFPLVVLRNNFWSPGYERQMEEGLNELAESRISIYRTVAPPEPGRGDADGNIVNRLRDGRIALRLLPDARIRVPLPAGACTLRLELGHLESSKGKTWIRATLFRGGAGREPLWSELTRRSAGAQMRFERSLDLPPGSEVEFALEPDCPRVSPPREVEIGIVIELGLPERRS